LTIPNGNIIYAPTGAYANHMRWLLLLDQKYPFEIRRPGESAAVYNTVESKIQLVKEKVYPPERTWHNWLVFEWAFRAELSRQYFYLEHSLNGANFSPDSKYLIMTISPELSYKSYVKFNVNLNNTALPKFKSTIEEFNQRAAKIASKESNNIMCINSEKLFSPVLDREIYEQVTAFFNLDPCYNVATDIHKQWYNLHKKAEIEIVRDLSNIYNIQPET